MTEGRCGSRLGGWGDTSMQRGGSGVCFSLHQASRWNLERETFYFLGIRGACLLHLKMHGFEAY